MKTLQWMAAAHRRTLTLAKPGARTVTITPGPRRGWTVRTTDKTTILDAVQLEDQLEAWNLRGYQEVPA